MKSEPEDYARLSLQNYMRNNALCVSSTVDFDARERKIRRLAPSEEDTDATSKSYVNLALHVAKDEIEYRDNAEKIASRLRKDMDEGRASFCCSQD